MCALGDPEFDVPVHAGLSEMANNPKPSLIDARVAC